MPYQKSKGLAVNATQRISVLPEPSKKKMVPSSPSRKSVKSEEYDQLKAAADEKDATIKKLAEEKQAMLQRMKALESAVSASKARGSVTDTKEMEEALRLCRIQMAEEEKAATVKTKKTIAGRATTSRPKSASAASTKTTVLHAKLAVNTWKASASSMQIEALPG